MEPIPQTDGCDDSSSNDDSNNNHVDDEEINSDSAAKNCLSFLFTNARSLTPKLGSLSHAFESLQLHGAGITETWFKGGKSLKEGLNELEDSTGIKILHKSRDGRKKTTGGGVAFAFCVGSSNFRQIALKTVSRDQEIMAVVGKIAGIKKKVVVFVVYIPPSTRAAEVEAAKATLVHEIAAARAMYDDPIIFVGGDFNKRDFGPAMAVAADLRRLTTGPTRGNATLDLVYTTIMDRIKEVTTLPPLDNGAGVLSDHRCIYIKAEFPTERGYNWVIRMKRTRTKAREDAFARDLACWDWRPLQEAPTVEGMTQELELAMSTLTEKHFPLARVRRRSNEDPWITRKIRRLWKKKVRVYKKEGKSDKWWRVDSDLQREIGEAKSDFVERLLEGGNNGKSFYAATRKLSAAKTTQEWTVSDLFVGLKDEEVADKVLDYFGGIAKSDRPGIPDLPRVHGGLDDFTVERTADLLRRAKKTDSIVEGDPLPRLFKAYPEQFALPVSLIFDRINRTGRWPEKWKVEHLTIIPKIQGTLKRTKVFFGRGT